MAEKLAADAAAKSVAERTAVGAATETAAARVAPVVPAASTPTATATVTAAPAASASRFSYKSKAVSLAALAAGTYYAWPTIQEFMTRKRPDAVQAPIDNKALEDQKPRVTDMRDSLAKGERPGARPYVAPPKETAPPATPEAMARRDLAERRASSQRSADLGAHATLYAAAGPEAPAEVIGKTPWGRYLAATKSDGTRQLVYETGDQESRRPAIFRNASGAEARVVPKGEAFVLSDQRVLAATPGSPRVEIDVFGVRPDGAAGQKLDTIKIENFPAVAPGPERRGDAVPGARRTGLAPG